MILQLNATTKEEIAKIAKSRLWFQRETVDLPLTDEQYHIFKKSYAPDWDCRYYPVYMDGWFYIVRSGVWLFKFKYEKKRDGLWHITKNYDTPFESGFQVMANVIREGYFDPQIFCTSDLEGYFEAMRHVGQVPFGVNKKPDYCKICHSPVLDIVYGEPNLDIIEKARRGQLIVGGCCVSEQDPSWGCPKCGSVYKNIADEWNRREPFIEYKRSPKICKKCGGAVVPVIYGLPTREMGEQADRCELILGGCIIEEGDYHDLECTQCHQGYYLFHNG